MPLVRRWMGDTLRASAATLLVPSAIVAALLAAALGSGLGGIGTLGQLIGGPSLPVAATRTALPAHHLPRLPVVPAGRAGGRIAASGGPATPGGGGGGTRRTASNVGSGGGQVRQPAASGPAPAAPGASTQAASSAPAPASSPPTNPSPPPPGPVHQLAQPVQNAAASLPAPAGTAASDAVGTVVDLVEPGGGVARHAVRLSGVPGS